MTVRLNVMLVQSAGMSGLQSEINAELAVQLMGVPGIDVAIVNSLRPDAATATDQLLLASTQNDLAVIDWREPSDVLRDLEQLGVVGARAPHRLDRAAAPVAAGLRRLYLIDLRRGDRPAVVADALRTLLQDRRVVAVPLAVPAASPRSAVSKPMLAPLPVAAGNAVAAPAANHGPAPTGKLLPSRPADSAIAPLEKNPPPVAGSAMRPSESDLDALVDGVNGTDW